MSLNATEAERYRADSLARRLEAQQNANARLKKIAGVAVFSLAILLVHWFGLAGWRGFLSALGFVFAWYVILGNDGLERSSRALRAIPAAALVAVIVYAETNRLNGIVCFL